MNKILRLVIFALLGAVILGLFGLLSGTLYGGNYGCFKFADFLFSPLRGYESCGLLGFWIGIILGAIIGFFLGRKRK